MYLIDTNVISEVCKSHFSLADSAAPAIETSKRLSGFRPPFDMRLVRRKQKELFAALANQPAGRFRGMRRELDLPPGIIRGLQWKSQTWFRAPKSLLRDIEPLHPGNHP